VSAERWTLCAGCCKPVSVTPIAPERLGDGESWEYACDACDYYASADDIFPDLDVTENAPPPPDPLAMLAAIVAPIVERAGREAVAKALGFGVTNG